MSEDQEAEGPSPSNAELFAILENAVRAVHAQGARQIYEQARLDALQAICMALGCRAGLNATALESLLTKWTQAFYQKRLDDLESVNPAAAAAADIRPGIPDLDPEILDHMRRAFEELDQGE